MKLSILITLLNEELVLPQTHREISNQLEQMLGKELSDYEILYIDDGSSDKTFELIEEFAREMFKAGSNLKDKSPEEIFYQDYKKFEFGDVTFGVGQINSMSGSELDELERRLRPYLEKSCREHGLSMMFFMLTNIIEESTRLMCYGESADMLVEDAFGRAPKAGTIWLKGVVSRKKQLIPAFIDAISKEAGGGV